jgi:glycosyltransferase involved in cell wall biosynthesis
MKILEICTVDFSLTGIPVHIRNYYNELKKYNQIDIVAKSFDNKILNTMPLENGTVLYELPRTKNPFSYIIKLKNIIKKNKYDIVHIHGNSATMTLELLACKKAPTITIVHTHNIEYKAKVLNILLKPYLLKHADLCFAASAEAGNKLYGNKRKFTIIENGINTLDFKFNPVDRNTIRGRYNIDNDKIVLGHVGTFNEQKNQEFLLRISEKLDPQKYHFFLVGDGKKEKFLAQLSNKKMFTIVNTTSEISKFYSAFDIFLFPSRYEGLGMAAVEAQYSGLPTIVSERVPRAVKVSNNIEFLPLKVNEWVEAIKTRVQNGVISKRNQNIVSSKFDITNCSKKLMNLYIKEYNDRIKKNM